MHAEMQADKRRMQLMTVTVLTISQAKWAILHWLLTKPVPSQEPPRHMYTPLSFTAPQKQGQPAVAKPRWPESQGPPVSTASWQNSCTSASVPHSHNELYLSLLGFCKITHVLLAEYQLHRHRRPKVLLPDGEQQL